MSLLRCFFPDYHLRSVYDLTPAWLADHGFRALILDIDNTLVSPNAPADAAARDFAAQMLAAGVACLVLSNNGEERACSFAADLGWLYLAKAKKPSPKGFRKALELLHADPSSTLAVGDQFYTDVLGAHRAGLRSLLVDALDPAHEQSFVRVKRFFERPLRRAWLRSRARERRA
ncbi:MAG: YqeG family HAD IIIA-type phosphatase [Lachnospiraceae bacterium]|nr:YqeG family HAD IIIA-type phosphatase [Lachnospiraceae bacterium]